MSISAKFSSGLIGSLNADVSQSWFLIHIGSFNVDVSQSWFLIHIKILSFFHWTGVWDLGAKVNKTLIIFYIVSFTIFFDLDARSYYCMCSCYFVIDISLDLLFMRNCFLSISTNHHCVFYQCIPGPQAVIGSVK